MKPPITPPVDYNKRYILTANSTDLRYWDCECDTNYMHPKSEPSCPECNTRSEDQPDSRINELLTTLRGYKLPERMP